MPSDNTPRSLNTYGMTDLGYKIFLDRYSLKDVQRTSLQTDDVVIAIVNAKGHREIGWITSIDRDNNQVVIDLVNGKTESLHIDQVDKPLELDPLDMAKRVSHAIAKAEDDAEKQAIWTQNFEWLLDDWRFVPGGRILTGAGNSAELSFFNCFVIGPISDSRSGIFDKLKDMAEIMSRGGGVGVNVSSLRPRYAYVKGVNGRSSGSVSWGALFSFVTGLIEQAGCFVGDTLIATNKGLLDIEQVIARVNDGEQILARTHKGYHAITDTFNNGVKEVYKLTTEYGFEVTVTGNHPVAVFQDGKVQTMKVDYINEGDEIISFVAPAYIEEDEKPNDRTTFLYDNKALLITKGRARVLGVIQQGLVRKNFQTTLTIANHEKESVLEFLELLTKEQFESQITEITQNEDAKTTTYKLEDQTELRMWLLFNSAPEAFLDTSSFLTMWYLRGLFSAAGMSLSHHKTHDRLTIMLSTNQANIYGTRVIQLMLTNLGVFAKYDHETGNLIIDGALWINAFNDLFKLLPSNIHIAVGKQNTKQLENISGDVKVVYGNDGEGNTYSVVPVAYARKQEHSHFRQEDVATASAIHYSSQLVIDKVRSIQHLGMEKTYDITVDEVHMLSANGVYTSNSRRGALMIILNDWHPDLLEFINSKRTAGQITNANISVGISDSFMEAVKNDGNWDFVFPDTTHAAYDEEWDGILENWQAKGYPVVVYQTVKAREVWNTIIESAWSSAEPGIWFRERSNKMSNTYYYPEGYLPGTNPCITGDTYIYTDQGMKTALELYSNEAVFQVAQDTHHLKGKAFTQSSRVFKTGTKQVYRIITEVGYEIRVTGDHKIFTTMGWREARQLRPDDKIRLLDRVVYQGDVNSVDYQRGLNLANREMYESTGSTNMNLAHHPIAWAANEAVKEEAVTLVRNKAARLVKEAMKGSDSLKQGYLAGLLKGATVMIGEDSYICMHGSNIDHLRHVQMLLLGFGVVSIITPASDDLNVRFALIIGADMFDVFDRVFGFRNLLTDPTNADKLPAFSRTTSDDYYADVLEVIEDGIEDVYDVTVPETHAFIANGMVVHNCAEQPLPNYGVCNLGAINLGRFYNADNADVDWDSLKQAVRYAVRFLDDVVTANPYFMKAIEDQELNERRIGLGIMGLAELLIKMEIRYGSPESEVFIDRIMRYIAVNAYEASADLAAEKGSFTWFETEPYLNSGFMRTMPESVREKIRQQGVRNSTVLTIAPTGSTASMLNTSTGIEPFFSWVYYRQGRLGMHEQHTQIAQDWLTNNPGETELPEFFVTAMQLTPEQHVKAQATAQRWVDSAISKTANVPNSYTVEQTRELYELMYELGCKGGTIYRDGSRDEQVLTLKKEVEPPVTEPHEDNGSVNLEFETKVFTVEIQPEGTTEVEVLASTGTSHYGLMYGLYSSNSSTITIGGVVGDNGELTINPPEEQKIRIEGASDCEMCGHQTLVMVEGCETCNNCGYSLCGYNPLG